MKKLFLSLAVLFGTISIVASAAEFSTTNSETVAANNEITIWKKTGNGNMSVKQKVQYSIENNTVYILYRNQWYKANSSNMTGYDYMVDLGRVGVWYFNL